MGDAPLPAAGCAFLLAAAFYPALALGREARRTVLVSLGFAVGLTPLFVSPERPFARYLAAVTAVMLTAKLYDLHVGGDGGRIPDFSRFLRFLSNLGSGVLRRLDGEPDPSFRDDLARLAGMGTLSGLAVVGLRLVFGFDWRRFPFVVEHCAKVLTFFVALLPTSAAAAALWRLLGWKVREPMDNPLLATTPADFWRRYNRLVQQFLYEDVFRQIGGRRHLVLATLATFGISALLHEYAFDIATGRVEGYQLAFFLIQGGAVAATVGIKPKGWQVLPWRVATLGFNLATSMIFFANMNELLPFYCPRPLG